MLKSQKIERSSKLSYTLSPPLSPIRHSTLASTTSPDLFQKLFRQDLLVASLLRNFLLADRVMRCYNCTPVLSPWIPSTCQHPMWAAWDLALDLSLSQLVEAARSQPVNPAPVTSGPGPTNSGDAGTATGVKPTVATPIAVGTFSFKTSTFFAEQLTAFQVWLQFGERFRPPPEQLPIVLQVFIPLSLSLSHYHSFYFSLFPFLLSFTILSLPSPFYLTCLPPLYYPNPSSIYFPLPFSPITFS